MATMANQYFQWKHATSRRNEQPGFLLWLPYDEETVRRMKAMVPSWGREWHDDNSTWWVHRDFANVIEELYPGFMVGVDASWRLPGFEAPPVDA